jgi:adenine-specific DNA-methyltransferase
MSGEKLDKLKLHSPDLTQDNIAKIRDLFPGCVTEARDAAGQLKLAVDFDQLRQELSDHIVEGPQERYHLNWPGKREALLTANAPIAKTLRPAREESVNFDTTQNLFIEGDNLEALKLLQESYLGKVKMIYIDPPYNTGRDFLYEDDFSETAQDFLERSNQQDASGVRFVANTEANGRFHSDWLSMMSSRLKVARNILRMDGAVFVSIGQEEVGNLLSLCNEIFGSQNFVSVCSRVMKTGGQKGTHFSPSVDYILVFAKDIEELGQFREPISQNIIDNVYTSVEVDGIRKGERYRSMGLYQAMLEKRANQRYYIQAPNGQLIIPPGKSFPSNFLEGDKVAPHDGDGVWRWTFDRFKAEQEAGNITFVKSDRSSLVDQNGANVEWNVYYKIWLKDRLRDGQLPGNILEKFQSRHSSSELKKLDIPFEFAKPSDLIKYLATLICLDDGDTILDFFAGSGTTAHATMSLGSELGGRFKFIVVQIAEANHPSSEAYSKGFSNIAEISKERIRRAGKKILEGDCHPNWNKDVGFRVLKIDTSNMNDVYYTPQATTQQNLLDRVDTIKPDRSGEDLLFQVLVVWGVELSLPITRETILGRQVFFVDGNALAACFETGITEELVKELAKRQPVRAVFRDTGFASDAMKINVKQIFKQLSPGTDVKAI